MTGELSVTTRAATPRTSPAPRTAGGPGGARWTGAGLGAALGAAVFWLMHRALGDDALISVAFARTLARSGTWGLFPGITSNTQTSPLNVWLLGGVTAVIGHPIVVVGGLLCICSASIGWAATRLAERLDVHPSAGWLAIAIIATSPVMVSTVGLETFLAVAVLLVLTLVALEGRTVLTGALCGLAVLTRPDLAIPAAVLALALFVRGTDDARPRSARTVAAQLITLPVVAAAVALPWHVWSWFHLGGFVPDTTFVRTADASGPTILAAVPTWLALYPVAATASALPVALAVACAVWAVRRRREPRARVVLLLVAASWAYLLALAAIKAQGAGWYYGPAVACSATAVALTAGAGRAWLPRAGLGAVLATATTGVLAAGPAPWTWAPLVVNFARTEQYAAIAQDLPALTGGEPVLGPGEVGALAFYGTVPVLDFLTDPAITEQQMRERAGNGFRATLLAWSARHRPPATPIPARWRLTFAGDGSTPASAGRVVRTWPIDSPTRGRDAVVLTEIG